MVKVDYCTIEPLGETAIIVRFGNKIEENIHRKVYTLSSYLDQHILPGVVEYVPAFTNITIYYDLLEVASLMDTYQADSPYEVMKSQIEKVLHILVDSHSPNPEIVEIPVCYGGEYGPDLEFVAEYNGLSPEEVIRIHSEGRYLTYMIGFAPGFPYLGGLSEKIAAPRKGSPRLTIPEGSVGIASNQTGVYPITSPGGWQIIGRTPLRLFQPNKNPPTLISAGNIVVFKPITNKEYMQQLLKVMT